MCGAMIFQLPSGGCSPLSTEFGYAETAPSSTSRIQTFLAVEAHALRLGIHQDLDAVRVARAHIHQVGHIIHPVVLPPCCLRRIFHRTAEFAAVNPLREVAIMRSHVDKDAAAGIPRQPQLATRALE